MPQYVRLIANNDLYNPSEYGRARAGREFMCPQPTAQKLVKQGSAREVNQSVVLYETKVIYPEAPEVRARDPFRDLPLPDEKSLPMAAESNPVFPVADVPEPGAADRGKRAGRKASDTGK